MEKMDGQINGVDVEWVMDGWVGKWWMCGQVDRLMVRDWTDEIWWLDRTPDFRSQMCSGTNSR